MFITSDESEARMWLDKKWAEEARELRDSQDKSKNADYDFY
jgi:hypothetical protein